MAGEAAPLTGQVAIVTGGSGAIGRAIFDALTQAGARTISLDVCNPGAQRHWVRGLAKSVAREVGNFGILVNVVEPGWVRTPLTEIVPQEVRRGAGRKFARRLRRARRRGRIRPVCLRARRRPHYGTDSPCGRGTVPGGF